MFEENKFTADYRLDRLERAIRERIGDIGSQIFMLANSSGFKARHQARIEFLAHELTEMGEADLANKLNRVAVQNIPSC